MAPTSELLHNSLGRSFIATGLVRFVSASGTMILSVVLARVLSKVDFGLFSFCMVSLVTLSMLARWGLESTMLRFGGAAWHRQDHDGLRGYTYWATTMTLRNATLISVLGAFILIFMSYGSVESQLIPVMLWMLLALAPWSLLYVVSAVLKATYRTPMGSVFEAGTVNHLVTLIVLVLLAAGASISSDRVAAVLAVSSLFVCTTGFLCLARNGLSPRRNERINGERSVFCRSSRDVAVIVVMQMLANWGGAFFLGIWHTNEEVANYAAPARIAAATILLTNIVILVIAPRLSGLHAAKRMPEFYSTLRRGCQAVALLNVPILAIIAVKAPWIMQLMGPSYVPHWPLLSIIAVGQMIGLIAGLAPTVLCMTGEEQVWRKATVVNAVFCIVLTGALSHRYGAIGAAIGTATYQASQNWIAAFLVRLRHGFWTIPIIRLRTNGQESSVFQSADSIASTIKKVVFGFARF